MKIWLNFWYDLKWAYKKQETDNLPFNILSYEFTRQALIY